MKKRCFLLCAVMICAALAFPLSASAADADSLPAIYISEQSDADGVRSLLLSLSGGETGWLPVIRRAVR